MDLCHCAQPDVRENEHKALFCAKCMMWFDPQQWKRDPRVKTAQFREARELNEAEEITDFIMRRGKLLTADKR